MKFYALLFLSVFEVSSIYGQQSPAPEQNPSALLAQSATPKAPAVTSIEGTGTKDSASRARTAATASTTTPSSVTLFKRIEDGGWAIIVLALLSVVTVMMVIVYFFSLRRGSIVSPQYLNTAEVLLKKRDYLGLLAISNRHTETVAQVIRLTLDFATKNPTANYDVVREIAETAAGAHAAALQHRTVYLADIGMLAPMIGLLGTVFGIISSFSDLATGDARDAGLAGGVSAALVATAGGLILGIVSMFFYAIFRNRVQTLISDLEVATAQILALIAINYDKKRDSSKPAKEEPF